MKLGHPIQCINAKYLIFRDGSSSGKRDVGWIIMAFDCCRC